MSLSSIAPAFVLVGLACLVGCAATPTPTPPVTADNGLEGFRPDQDVPLIAPDEAEAASRPRLTETKTIGGGANDTSVDRGRRGTASSASTLASGTTSAPVYRRGYYRSSGAAATAATSGTATANYATAAAPAAGGNFPSAPSYGTPAMGSTSRH